MKKFLVLIACLLLAVFATGSVVSAAGLHDPTTGTTNVIYSVGSTYLLQVPADLYLDNGRTLEVKIYNGRISGNQKIVVNVTSEQFDINARDKNGNDVGGLWALISDDDDILYYHIHRITDNGNVPVKNGGMVYEVTGDQLAAAKTAAVNGGSATEFYLSGMIDIHLDSIETHSGEFTDILSFTSEVVDIT